VNRFGPGNAVVRADPAVWLEPAVEPEAPRPFLVDEEYVGLERRQLRLARLEQCVQLAALLGYAALIAVAIAFHEPWADEAQAWLLARDQTLGHLLFHAIRYEGSPGLWHCFLWVLAQLRAGYIGMHWISGLVALAGVYVLLRWSPFPLVLKAILPFGFWLAYQDSVIARSYVLFAILAFPAAATLRGMSREDQAPRAGSLLWLAVVLGLMANISVHGFVASIGFALVALALLRRHSQAGRPVSKTMPVVVLCCFWIFAAVTVFPPSDVNFPAGKNIEVSARKVWAAFGSQTAKAELQEEKLEETQPRPGELAKEPELNIPKTPAEARWHKAARILGLITFPVSNFRVLALVACALALIQALVFGSRRGQIGWVGLMPWALMILIFSSVYLAPRHAGMIWEALIASLWLTWPAGRSSHWYEKWINGLTIAAFALVGINQAQWTAHSVWDDIHKPYSGDEAMAQWLKTNEAGKRIAGFDYHSVGVTAWFNGPLYFNQPTTYWIWSQGARVDARAPFTIATHPDVIVVGGFNWSAQNADISEDWVKPDFAELNRVPLNDLYHVIPYAEAHGYRETHRFCGHAFMRGSYAEEQCQVALEPVPGSTPSGPQVQSSLIPVPNEPTLK